MNFNDDNFKEVMGHIFAAKSDQEWEEACQRIPKVQPDPLLLFWGQTLEVLETSSRAILAKIADDTKFGLVDRGWVRVHNLYKVMGHPQRAYQIITRLYPFMRRYEIETNKWWHKGNPCWFMGLSALECGRVVEARLYFTLALIEDAITYRINGNTHPSKLPAYAWLSSAVSYSSQQAQHLLDSITSVLTGLFAVDPTEPERTYIRAICRIDHFMEEWADLPFLQSTAQALLKWALGLKGHTTGGEPLEVVTCYLVETTPGLRAAMRVKGTDAENDILIRNNHETGPLSDFGRYFLAQCKNPKKDAVGAPVLREFVGRLAETGCTFGVFVSPTGITGRTTKKNIAADRVLLKAQQRTGITVSVLNGKLLSELCVGTKQLLDVLPGHYVEERFDLYRK